MPLWGRSSRSGDADGAVETVAGYRDLQRVGRGGFSVVYRARQDRFDRVVALKILSVDLTDSQVRRRFLREVTLTSRLTGHPHVVTVLDSGVTAAGRPYLAMEYFDRGSLADRLAAEGPLPLADVLRVGVKLAGALGAAHREGILHRDVKPQNILVSRYGEPALTDFGTARPFDALDVTSRTEALTPYHAAPEVLRGEPPTVACDVYSLGSTLYQLLAGRPAYRGDGGIAALLLRILREDLPPIARAEVPAPVTAVLATAMAKEAGHRYPDTWALAGALQRVQVELGLPVTDLADAPSLPADQLPGVPPVPVPAAAVSVEVAPPRPEPPRPIPIEVPAGGFGWDSAGPDHALVTTVDSAGGSRQTGARPDDASVTTVDFGGGSGVEAGTGADGSRRTGGGNAGRVGAARDQVGATRDQVGATQDRVGATRDRVRNVRAEGSRRPAIVVAVVALALSAALVPLLFLQGRKAPAPPLTGPSSPAASTPAVSRSPVDVAAARPTALVAKLDAGTSVTLHWKLAPGTATDNLYLVVAPRDPGTAPLILNPGLTSYTVAGLNPTTGYCFQVGPILLLGTDGQTGTAALSAPTCIRGAVASPSA